MTEKEVQLLGFEKEEFSDWDGDWHYYSYRPSKSFKLPHDQPSDFVYSRIV